MKSCEDRDIHPFGLIFDFTGDKYVHNLLRFKISAK